MKGRAFLGKFILTWGDNFKDGDKPSKHKALGLISCTYNGYVALMMPSWKIKNKNKKEPPLKTH